MAASSTYTITANDFVFLECTKAVEENGIKFPTTYTFVECTDDTNTIENAAKYRKNARVYSMAKKYCSGVIFDISKETELYVVNGEYIGDNVCPVKATDNAPPTNVPTGNPTVKTMFETGTNQPMTFESTLSDAKEKSTSIILESVKDTILNKQFDIDKLKGSALDALKDIAPGALQSLATGIGVDTKTLSAITSVIDFVGGDNILNGDIDAIKAKLLEQLELKNLLETAAKPEVLSMLSKTLGIPEDILSTMIDSANTIKTLSDIQDLKTYQALDIVFKSKLAKDLGLRDVALLDGVVTVMNQYNSDDPEERKKVFETAQKMGTEFISLLSPEDSEPEVDHPPGSMPIVDSPMISDMSKMDYKVQKVAAIALGFGLEENGVDEMNNTIEKIRKFKELDEQSKNLKAGLTEHVENLEIQNRYNSGSIEDYQKEHGLTSEQFQAALTTTYDENLKSSSELNESPCDTEFDPIIEQYVNSNDPIYSIGLNPALAIKDASGQYIGYNGDIILTNNKNNITAEPFKSIPFKFKTVNGKFICKNIGLTSLENAPDIVEGDFDCSGNELISLEFGPKSVGGNYIANKNKLENLDGLPSSIGQNLNLSENRISSLENLGCGKSSTTSGCPTTVFGDVNLSNNDLKSLNNANLNIRGTLDVSKNELTDATIFTGIREGLGGKNENFNSDIRVKKFIGVNQQPDGVGKLSSSLIEKTLQIDNITV